MRFPTVFCFFLSRHRRDDIDSDEEEEMKTRGGVRGGSLYSGSKYSRMYKNNDVDDDDDW